ncbi:alpha/beta-hydrolase [Corynespora cassiicola Philippines]|uniref:Alpha/beta-hydrolase n=1 Tax=Corynespora cassiicola Philippines TaxID=1448308 RepID=A0A2T2NN09_CORCC|nr:alpha/beta-hydrolase [Corynespora cassiicola Philippines]
MSRAADDIAFVLVPPSFSPASFYDKVVPLLEKNGFAAHPVDLKSVNDGEEAPVSMYEDADKIHSVAAQLLDQGKGVVLVASSYGGIPATQATKGLGKEERRAVSKPGAVVSIVYLASFVVPEGSCINDLVAGRMPQNEQKPPDYMSMDPEADGKKVFKHLNDSERTEYASRFNKHSSRSFDDRLTYAGYLHIPSVYVVATDDVAISPEMSQGMVEEAISKGAKIVSKNIHSDHFPMISHPEEVVEILIDAAEQGVKLLHS